MRQQFTIIIMKVSKIVIALCCALIGITNVCAQDVITKTDGSTILSKVVSISDSVVTYKSYANIDGPTYILNKSNINYITYTNGTKEYFGERISTSNYGANTVTDAQLLEIYKRNIKAEKYDKIALIGGLTIFGACSAAGILASTVIDSSIKEWLYVGPCGGFVLGAAWFATFKIMSNRLKNHTLISSAPIFEQEIQIGNNARLMAGVDVLSDVQFNSSAVGVGMRLKF